VFKRQVGAVKAVDGDLFDLHQGETLGIVGESGCGKVTVAKLLMSWRRRRPARSSTRGQDITRLSGKALRRPPEHPDDLQDPYNLVNPRIDGGRHHR